MRKKEGEGKKQPEHVHKYELVGWEEGVFLGMMAGCQRGLFMARHQFHPPLTAATLYVLAIRLWLLNNKRCNLAAHKNGFISSALPGRVGNRSLERNADFVFCNFWQLTVLEPMSGSRGGREMRVVERREQNACAPMTY